jgi:NodT family efflux transporter outer membrane factor (OMF) lipoprotein
MIPPLEAQLAQARHALALLVGHAPGDWTAPDFDLASFKAPTQIPLGVPSELVRRRPDILAAEAALHAATADIGVETAKLYPDLKLTAGYTEGALKPSNIFNYDSSGWNFGPSLSVPLFDAGRRKADRDAAVSEAKAADARYRQTVLIAFNQVADALDALGRDDALIKARNDQMSSAQRSFDDAQRAYDLGGGTLINVVDAQRRLSRARRDLVASEGDRYAHIVDLFTATAADWRPA